MQVKLSKQEQRIALFSQAIAIAEDLRTMGQEAMLTLDLYASLSSEKLAYLQGFLVAKLDNPIDLSRDHLSKTKISIDKTTNEPIKSTLYFTLVNQNDFKFWMYGVTVSVSTRHWVLCSQCKGLYDGSQFYISDRQIHDDFFDYIKNNSQ